MVFNGLSDRRTVVSFLPDPNCKATKECNYGSVRLKATNTSGSAAVDAGNERSGAGASGHTDHNHLLYGQTHVRTVLVDDVLAAAAGHWPSEKPDLAPSSSDTGPPRDVILKLDIEGYECQTMRHGANLLWDIGR